MKIDDIQLKLSGEEWAFLENYIAGQAGKRSKEAVDAITIRLAEAQTALTGKDQELKAKSGEFEAYKKIVEGGTQFIQAKIEDKSLDDKATVQAIATNLPLLINEANKSDNQRKLDALEQQAAALSEQIAKQRASLPK